MELVAAGVIRRASQILLCHRHPWRVSYPDVWDLPGGHVEAGESLRGALERELHEELGIRVGELGEEPWRVLKASNIELGLFVVDHWHGEPQNMAPDEHSEIRWIEPERLRSLDLAHPSYGTLLLEAARWRREESAT